VCSEGEMTIEVKPDEVAKVSEAANASHARNAQAAFTPTIGGDGARLVPERAHASSTDPPDLRTAGMLEHAPPLHCREPVMTVIPFVSLRWTMLLWLRRICQAFKSK
jgi:hypothetical protein